MGKVVVIGLDGFSPMLVDLLASEMPTLAFLKKHGFYSKMESTIPPLTIPAWISMFTGKNPGKLGVYGFFDFKFGNARVVNSLDVKAEFIFETMERYGKRAILINLPGSFPWRCNQVFLPSFLEKKKVGWPLSLDISGYPFAQPSRAKYNYDPYRLAPIYRKIARQRFEFAKRLFSRMRWDLFFVLFSVTDWLQHTAYHLLLEKPAELIALYKDLDSYIAWFLENLREDDLLLVVSDHGFRTFENVFYINQWLLNRGLVKLKPFSLTPEEKGGFFIPPWLLNVLRPLFPILRPLYRKLKGHVSAEYIGDIGSKAFGFYSSRPSLLYSQPEVVDLLTELEFVEKVERPNYRGPCIRSDIYAIWLKDDWTTMPTIRGVETGKMRVNAHDLYGVFFLYGEKVATKDVSIYDVAPTILTALGIPVPQEVDGRSLISGEVREKEYPWQKWVVKGRLNLRKLRSSF